MIFSDTIILWYNKNKRDLPWRKTVNPYKIWISEIILQQTKVVQGLPYYNNFIRHFPTIVDLANSDEDMVMKIWQGLGYYSRARNLHFTAKFIVNELNSKFPDNYNDLLKLKGIGDYTASAISSFCFNLPHAVLDGNVSRVISRYMGIELAIDSPDGKRLLKKLSHDLLNKKYCSIHNQAIMEFGALMCVPKSPNCSICPLSSSCVSYGTNLVSLLPNKNKVLKVKNRYFNFLIISSNNKTYIEKRKKGIWKSLYQFPLIEGEFEFDKLKMSKEWLRLFNSQVDVYMISKQIKHKLSHQLIHANFYHIKSHSFKNIDLIEIDFNNLDEFAFPTLIDKYLKSVIFD